MCFASALQLDTRLANNKFRVCAAELRVQKEKAAPSEHCLLAFSGYCLPELTLLFADLGFVDRLI